MRNGVRLSGTIGAPIKRTNLQKLRGHCTPAKIFIRISTIFMVNH